jgi:hypothetical protein
VAALVEKKKMKRVATRSEGVVAAPKEEGRGVAEVDEEAQLVEGVSSLSWRAQTLVLSKQGVHSKSSAAWPGRVIASHIPRSGWEIYRAQIGGMSQSKNTHLILPFPVENIVDPTEAAHIEGFARLDEHV